MSTLTFKLWRKEGVAYRLTLVKSRKHQNSQNREGIMASCGACGGRGKITRQCGNCGGAGRIHVTGDERVCSRCGGSGLFEESCSRCGGSGQAPGRPN